MNGKEYIEEAVVEKVRESLERSVAELDGRTAESLRQARLTAMEAAAAGKARWYIMPRWATAGAIAAIAVIVTAVSLWFAVPHQTQMVAQVEDMDILATHEHLEIYEDIDFYRWLADRNAH